MLAEHGAQGRDVVRSNTLQLWLQIQTTAIHRGVVGRALSGRIAGGRAPRRRSSRGCLPGTYSARSSSSTAISSPPCTKLRSIFFRRSVSSSWGPLRARPS